MRLRLKRVAAFGMRLSAFEARDIILTDLTIRTLVVCELLAYKVGMRIGSLLIGPLLTGSLLIGPAGVEGRVPEDNDRLLRGSLLMSFRGSRGGPRRGHPINRTLVNRVPIFKLGGACRQQADALTETKL